MGLWLTKPRVGALTGGDWEPSPSVFQSPSTEGRELVTQTITLGNTICLSGA